MPQTLEKLEKGGGGSGKPLALSEAGRPGQLASGGGGSTKGCGCYLVIGLVALGSIVWLLYKLVLPHLT